MSVNNEKINAYCAGLFDGEGCLIVAKASKKYISQNGNPKYQIRCLVSNTNTDILKFIQKYFGGAIHGDKPRRTGWKPLFHWYASSAKAFNFLHAIYPYLIIKRAKAEVAFEFEAELLPRYHGRTWLTKEQIARRDFLKQKLSNTK